MAMEFDFNLEANLSKIVWELSTGKYRPYPYKYFVVHDPKTRNIAAPHFRDRVVQHSLVSVIEPIFEKKFIYDSYACRKDRGTHFGLKRLKKFLQAARTCSGKNAEIYVLQCDIRKFFPSVSWKILFEIIEKTINSPQTRDLIQKIITIHSAFGGKMVLVEPDEAIVLVKERRGLPIGNLTSQLFANIYLNELDHFVKENLRERWYGRYMDDFFIISPSEERLKIVREEIRTFLKEKLELNLHPKKVNIKNVQDGVSFVGYRVFYDHILIRGSTLLRFQKKYRKYKKILKKGKITQEYLRAVENSFKGHLRHANAWGLRKKLFACYSK